MPVDNRFNEQFPHLDAPERELLMQLCLAKETNGPTYEALKDKFLTQLETWLMSYCQWDTLPEQRIMLRRKLLNLAGLWHIIPFQELQALVNRTSHANKRPITDVKIADLYQDDLEIPAYDLKYLDNLVQLLGSIIRDDGTTYLDFVAGSRGLKSHPPASTIVFKKNLAEEVSSQERLTASAETFTRTILITTFNEEGDYRDLVSIAFDLVLESTYLDSYHNWTEEFQWEKLLLNTKVAACQFLEKVIKDLHLIIASGIPLMNRFEIFPRGSKTQPGWEIHYLDFLKNRLLQHHQDQIFLLSRKLGL